MEQVNAVIDCDVSRLDFPLHAMKARAGHNFVALIRRAPADVTGLFVRIFRADGVSYFDITAHEHPGGEWVARIPAACFPSPAESKYEIHATAADDQPAAIGEGRLVVAPFSTTTTPLPVGTVQEVTQLPCEGGGYVQVVMKWDGFEWMPEAVPSATANDATEDD